MVFMVQSGHRIILIQMTLSSGKEYLQLMFSIKNIPFFIQNLAPNKKHLQLGFDFVQNPSFLDHFKRRSENTLHTLLNNKDLTPALGWPV
jgi:hypothetical protein